MSLHVSSPPDIIKSSRKLGPISTLYTIKELSNLIHRRDPTHQSEIFESGGFKWRVCFDPKASKKPDSSDEYDMSLSLTILDVESLDNNWEVHASITFFMYNNTDKTFLTFQDKKQTEAHFHPEKKKDDLRKFMKLADLKAADNGFVKDDSCLIGAEVLVLKQRGKKELAIVKEPGTENSFTHKVLLDFDIQEPCYPYHFKLRGADWLLNFHPAGWHGTKDKFVTFSLNLETKEPGKQWRSIHRIRILDQNNGNDCEVDSGYKCFTDGDPHAPIMEFMPVKKFHDRSMGYIKDDTVIIQLIFSYMSVH